MAFLTLHLLSSDIQTQSNIQETSLVASTEFSPGEIGEKNVKQCLFVVAEWRLSKAKRFSDMGAHG